MREPEQTGKRAANRQKDGRGGIVEQLERTDKLTTPGDDARILHFLAFDFQPRTRPTLAAMNAYKIQERLGDGAFGEVAKALHPETGATVAIKRIKRHFHTWEECLQLRELQSLKKLGGSHPNIVKLKQVVREEKLLYFVFEFCETNLHRVVQQAGRGGVG